MSPSSGPSKALADHVPSIPDLNDRSQCGDHDSEIAVVVEGEQALYLSRRFESQLDTCLFPDMDMVKTTMDGKPYEAARFAKAWRQTLMKEHLGLLPAQGTHPFGETPKVGPIFIWISWCIST